MRRWVLWLLIVVVAWLVVRSLSEIELLGQTLARGQWQWILAAVGLQVGYYTLYGLLYQAAFHTVGVQRRVRELLPIFFAALFADVAAPSIGASAAALYVDEAARNGHSPGRTAAGVLLARLVDFSTFLALLVFGLIYLFAQDALQPYEVIASAILVGIVLAMIGVLRLASVNPALLHDVLTRVQGLGNGLAARVHLRPLLKPDWAVRHAAEFTEAAWAIGIHPGRLGKSVAMAVALYAAHVACLYALFRAFQVRIGFEVLLGGYVVGMLFWVVSITPHGVGVVEGVMTLLYTSLGVPGQAAAVVVLAFRGLTFWLPLGVGFFAMRWLKPW